MEKQSFDNQNGRNERLKIAIVHPRLGLGGSEAVVLQIVAALKDKYNVSLITSAGSMTDISLFNKYYHTNLDPKEFSIIKVSMPLGLENTAKLAAVRGRLIQRYCQKVVSNFDLMISAYNFCDFGIKSIQYAMDIETLPEILPLRNWKRWWYGNTLLRKFYFKTCDLVSPINIGAWKKDFTLALSNWTAKLIIKRYGISPYVLYPPVTGDFPVIPYKNREDGFVCIGRIVPEKRFDEIIDILERLRERGGNTHLHVVGRMDNSRYAKFLKEKCSANKDWIFIEDNLNEKEKNDLMMYHRFGISARKNEPFGIAVAEMVKAGCIVFVPNGGGQVEIVNHPSLIYNNIGDAVTKIEQVIKSDAMQIELLKHLAKQAENFSVDNFAKNVKDIVSNFFIEKYGKI